MTKRPKSQIEKFREAARDVGCDDSEEHFDAALKAVAKHAPAKDKRPSKKKDSQD
jgi:hypothetical protein